MNKSFVFIYLLIFSTSSFASDFESARASGLGGASAAGPLLNDAVYLNPSFASFSESYALSAHYQFYDGPGTGSYANTKGKVLNISVLDGRTESFQAGLGFTKRDYSTWVHAGASKSFLPRVSAGVGAKFFFGNSRLASGHDGSISFSYLPTDWFQSALIADNLLDTDRSKEWGLKRNIKLGIKCNIQKIVLLYFDPHYTPASSENNKIGFNAGTEFPLMTDLFLRSGYFRNSNIAQMSRIGSGFSLGGGWIAPRFSLDYGYSKAITPRENILHNFGMTVFF